MYQIDGKNITFRDVYKIANSTISVNLSNFAKQKVEKAKELLEEALKNKETIYGVTTGFGAFKNTPITTDEIQKSQTNLILSHAVAIGKPLCDKIVKAIIFLIANHLAKGYSGVRSTVIDSLLQMINKGVYPLVPEKGSVGSSGDLAPSAHIALVFLGEGEANYKGKRYSGHDLLVEAGIKQIKLEPKEGLSLLNNTATMTALAVFALAETEKLLKIADIAGALSVEAHRGTTKAYDKDIHRIRPQKGQIRVAKNLRRLLVKSTMVDNFKTQDQYSLRCIPQVHGAVRDAFEYAKRIVNIEINSVTDNPLIFTENGLTKIISGGNFHGEPIAIVMDTLGLAVSELANISDRRVASILDPNMNNGMPAFLIENGGINSGMMILQYTTAALASENKILAHPASVDSIPTSANVEDFVSMGTISARKAREIIENVKNVLAIEILVTCQAIDFRLKEGFQLGKKTNKFYKRVRKFVPFFKADSIYYPYVQKIVELIEKDKL